MPAATELRPAPRRQAPDEPVDLLAVMPHPDDESSAAGGVLAKYARAGLRTAVIICTGGEEGEIHDPALSYEDAFPRLGAIRERELRAACHLLGVSEVRLLGYRDSGMAGSAANAHPNAFINVGLDTAADRLAGLIRRLRPRVVITENASGSYGHPDHRRCHQVTVRAWEQAADPAATVDGEPWQPARLYALAPVPAGHEQVLRQLRRLGLDTAALESMLGRRRDEQRGSQPTITASVDVSEYTEIQQAALLCHRTQIPADSLFMRLPPQIRRRAFATTHFLRLRPVPALGERDPDLMPS
jgi:N-acetyl-1-D-myo-inositol-2-amino-2-deoxy-alpha-D-glucopyranoside deacetylase